MTAIHSVSSLKASVILVMGCHADNYMSWNFKSLSILLFKVPGIFIHLITFFGQNGFFTPSAIFSIQLKMISSFLNLFKDELQGLVPLYDIKS